MSEIIEVSINQVDRLICTPSGNPRFRLWSSEGKRYLVSPDSSCSYEVENVIKVGSYDPPRQVKLHLNNKGSVHFYGIEKAR